MDCGTTLIIRRYLIRQVASTTLVVTALLTMIMIGGRLIKYFGVAAQGRLDVGVLLSIVALRLPEFLVLILPLGFFAGLMLVFGRLYVDHEMAVLNSSGVSRERLGWMLWPLVLLMVLAEASLSLVGASWGSRQSDQIFASQALRSGFDLVKPGEFVSSGAYTIYAGSLSDDRRELRDVFFYQRATEPNQPDRMILAERASRVTDPEQQASIVDLQNGRQYQFKAGQAEYNHAEFSYYRLRIEHDRPVDTQISRLETASVQQLWAERQRAPVLAELGFRLSMPWVMLLAAVMAVPLAQVNPRQGRYIRLIPSIMLFATVVVSLMAVKTRVSKNELQGWAFIAVLLGYLLLAIGMTVRYRLPALLKRRACSESST